MRIECIAIGTELLTTERLDTNSVWLAQRLADLGLAFHRKSCVGDRPEDLKALFSEALDRSDLIITSGGLGPTFDDLTKELWAELLGAPLHEDAQAVADMEARFRSFNRPMPPSNLKQALIPERALALRNPVGTAPGILWIDPPGHAGKWIVMLPGVPRELKALWDQDIEPRLRERAGQSIHTLRMLVGSVGESALEQRTEALRERHGHLDWTILASLGLCELVARDPDPARLEAARLDFEAELGEDRVRTGPGSLEQTVLEHLEGRGQRLALAESMTGGRIAAALTAVPGASGAFAGGAVVYAPEAKRELLGLDPKLLEEAGTVSEATSLALAEAARRRLGTDWGLAVTGNAGPTEDPSGPAPVGTAFIAIAGPMGARCHRLSYPGSRADIQHRATVGALDLLRRELLRGELPG